MDVMDLASFSLDIWLKKPMASDLDWLRWRSMFKSQLLNLWERVSIDVTGCASVIQHIGEFEWKSGLGERLLARCGMRVKKVSLLDFTRDVEM